jgi:hypothetical protein
MGASSLAGGSHVHATYRLTLSQRTVHQTRACSTTDMRMMPEAVILECVFLAQHKFL